MAHKCVVWATPQPAYKHTQMKIHNAQIKQKMNIHRIAYKCCLRTPIMAGTAHERMVWPAPRRAAFVSTVLMFTQHTGYSFRAGST